MSATTEASAQQRQRAAIAESEWGYVPRLVQPRNFTFWVTVFLLMVGIANWYLDTQDAIAAYSTELAQGIVYFALFGAFILWIILRLDRYSKIPTNVKILAILVGGMVSTFAMSLHYNDAFLSILTKTQGIAFTHDWGPGLTAPLSEELSKMVPLIVVIGLAPRVVRSAFDGLVIGMLSGMAFQIVEDVQYVWSGVDNGFGESSIAFTMMMVRTGFGFTGHWMWSGVVGAGLIYLIGRPYERRNVGLGLTLMITPMILHGMWDASAAIAGSAALLLNAGLGIATIGSLVWTYQRTATTEQQWMHDLLEPEVASGVITADELTAAAGRRKVRRRHIKAQQGHHAKRAAKHVIEAIHDLADELAVSRGTDSPEVDHARHEIARLRG